MKELHGFLEIVELALFAALGVLALYEWRIRGGRAAGWLAATFGILGAVAISGLFLPDSGSEDQAPLWITKVLVALIALLPYFLFRFTATFVRPRRLWEAVNAGLTVAVIVLTLFLTEVPEPGEPRNLFFNVFLITFLTQWGFILSFVAYQLLRSARGHPTVARRRMRTMAVGALGLAAVLVISGASSSEQRVGKTQIALQFVGIVSAVLFWFGFAPPWFVRAAWRRSEEGRLRSTELKLMEAIHPAEIADAVLPEVTHLVGGAGIVLKDNDGAVIGSHWLESRDVQRSRGEGTELRVPMRSGEIVVTASPFTPFFGRDETDMLKLFAAMVDLALERAALYQRERRAHDRLLEAEKIAHIGSWEQDCATSKMMMSNQLKKILGIDSESTNGDPEELIRRVHAEDRDELEQLMKRAVQETDQFDTEYRIVRDNGQVAFVHSQARVIRGEDGTPQRMIGTIHDITERKRQENLRERFIADAAHELRTPTTTLVGFVEMLERNRHAMSEDQIEEAIETMSQAGDRLTVLVVNLLDLSKIQQGQLEADLEPVSIAEVSNAVVKATPPPAGKSIVVRIDNGLTAITDRHRLDQILANLLTNAYRYGGTNIELSAKDNGESVVVSVDDDGPQIDEELAARVFDPFSRGQNATKVGGSGLGLAISKMLVELLGGEIWHEALQPEGNRFSVSLARTD
jgi:PAS domain S-box-containing protein